MPNKSPADQHLQDLTSLLEVYGADKARWPAADRMRLSAAIASDPRAQKLLAEAEALDRLLDMAPRVSTGRERTLAQQIVAAAAAGQGPSAQRPSTNVIHLSNARKPTPTLLRSPSRQAAAALLAASLVLGIFAGTSRQLSLTIDLVAEAVGLPGAEPEIALMDGGATPGEESL